ncbi:MAG: HPr family phosphocarrier protein [Anaerolineales bacterium]|nr:HPr family phosphocarrier protein [Anaerolineales bacterium]
MQSFRVVVVNEVGLHARPAAIFVQSAAKYKSEIKIRNLTNGKDFVDAKSILGVMMLGVSKDHQVEVEICGEDENAAAEKLKQIIDSDFEGLL